MEDERRAFERNKTNGSNVGGENRRQLESLQEELKKEIEDKRRLEKEERDKSAAWENEKKTLEERLQTVRKQLRNAKDKLKEYRESESNPHILSRPSEGRQSSLSKRDSSLSHSGNTFDADMTIATPGAIRTTADPRRQMAPPLEKSTFSITPYLNRQKPTPDSPNTSGEDLEAGSDPQPRIKKKPQPSKSSSRVDNRKENKKQPKKADAKTRRKIDDEEEASENHGADNNGDDSLDEDTTLPEKKATASKATQEGKQPQRKRKILGAQRDKTLFDDEDDDMERPAKDRRLTSALHSGMQAFRASRQTFSEKSNFSPLKRDKRLV